MRTKSGALIQKKMLLTLTEFEPTTPERVASISSLFYPVIYSENNMYC